MSTALPAQVPRTQVQCNGQIITEVVIRSQAPGYGGLFDRSPLLGRLVTSMHVATEPSVIENFVLLRRGERCSILLRNETERLLRAQPFLADAHVTAYQDGLTGVRVEVVTIDEPSPIASIGITDDAPYVKSLRFGNANLRGKGIFTAVSWRDGLHYRDAYQLSYANYQLFSRPWHLRLDAARREHGFDITSEISQPFLTEVQDRAWRVTGGVIDELVPFRSPDRLGLALGARREFVDIGGFLRLGEPGGLVLVGTSLSAERSLSDPVGTIVTDSGRFADTTGALDGRFGDTDLTRANLLLGFRRVNFLEVTGFDALAGTQDVRRGVQLGLTVGRALPVGSPQHEWSGAFDLYAGGGSPTSFIAAQVLGEGRWNGDRDRWEALLLSGRLAWYLKPHPRQTLMGSVEYGLGRRQLAPFQLLLGKTRGGTRGYEGAQVGGGARLVARLEERWRLGNIRGTADVGIAGFTDVGRVWAGDAPLGVTTGYRPSLGLSLLAAVPPRSRRMWRMDIAFPLVREAGAGWTLRITNEDRTRQFWIEPSDLRRARDRGNPMGVGTRDWGLGNRD